jgi:hypothetical protein
LLGGLLVCLARILRNNVRFLVVFRPFVSVLTEVCLAHFGSAFLFWERPRLFHTHKSKAVVLPTVPARLPLTGI